MNARTEVTTLQANNVLISDCDIKADPDQRLIDAWKLGYSVAGIIATSGYTQLVIQTNPSHALVVHCTHEPKDRMLTVGDAKSIEPSMNDKGYACRQALIAGTA